MRLAAIALGWALVAPPLARAQEPAQDAAAVPAQGEAEPAESDPSSALVTMDFDNVELVQLIKAMAKIAKKRFVYDDRVQGAVTIISQEPVTPAQAFRMFESVLQLKGFTVVEGTTGELKVIPSREVKQMPVAVLRGKGEIEPRDVFATRLIPLRYVKVAQIEGTLRQFASADASLIGDVRTNTLIVTDTGTNVARLLDIVAAVDVPLFEEQIKVIQLEHASAPAMTQQLLQIFGGEDSSGAPPAPSATQVQQQASLLRSRAQAAAAAARAAAAREAGAAGGDEVAEAAGGLMGASAQPRFIPDERTNSLLVMAPKAMMEQVEKIVHLLDYSRPGRGRLNIYPLKNADAEEMAKTLSALGEGGGGSAPVPGAAGGGAGVAGVAGTVPAMEGGAEAAAVAVLEGGVRITAESATNSLIIQASAQAYDALVPVIERLDVRRPQVLIEGLVLEVAVKEGETLGTSLLFNRLSGAGGFGVGSLPGGPAPGFGVPDVAKGILGAAAGDGFTSTLLGRLVDVSFESVDDKGKRVTTTRQLPVIQAVVNAIRRDGDANIMAAPQILTADNAEAQIVVGENRPFPTQQLQATSAGSSAGNPFQTSTQIERKDVGITLRVTPQISEGDSVRMKIFTEISNVIPDEASSLGPVTNNRTIENTVHVSDGESVMIGGIIQDSMSQSHTRVPLLGDLPLIGRLFGRRANDVVKTNLLLLLTPHIVRAPGDLEQLTLEQREKFRSASESGAADPEELERRRKAKDAGLDLPVDPNPVRRELEGLEQRYPTERLPDLREERQAREDERRERLEQQVGARPAPAAAAGEPAAEQEPAAPQDAAPAEPPPLAQPQEPAAPQRSAAPAARDAAPLAPRREAAQAEPAASLHRYMVQLEPLDDAQRALDLLAHWSALGHPGTVIVQQEGGRSTHFVRFGPYPSEAAARRAGRRIEKETELDAFVMLGQ